MEITNTAFEAANRRGAEKKASFPSVVSVRYDKRISRIVITFSSELDIAFAPRNVQGLEDAHPAELVDIEISPSGLGIHFPKLDVDLYLPAVLEGFFGSKKWMAAQMGKVGGKATTVAKASAARKNGKSGGRPRRVGVPVAA